MARMTRVSPPLLARGLPGPQASTSVTRAPRRRSSSAVQPPNAPAPTTATAGPVTDEFATGKHGPTRIRVGVDRPPSYWMGVPPAGAALSLPPALIELLACQIVPVLFVKKDRVPVVELRGSAQA